jgi:hypothetical protein
LTKDELCKELEAMYGEDNAVVAEELGEIDGQPVLLLSATVLVRVGAAVQNLAEAPAQRKRMLQILHAQRQLTQCALRLEKASAAHDDNAQAESLSTIVHHARTIRTLTTLPEPERDPA